MLDFGRFSVLTFDCYGTLMDWEAGILGALRPALAARGLMLDNTQILERYARYEAEAEAGDYQPYRAVLRRVAERFFTGQGIAPTEEERDGIVASFGDWRPFPDTVEALRALKSRYRLAIVSNVDDDLFALTAPHLEVEFDAVITAAQARSYKPSLNNFRLALARLNTAPEQVLHVAESLYHDIVPARALGISSVWVNRRQGRPGATRLVEAQPDMEVPDLRTLAVQRGLLPA